MLDKYQDFFKVSRNDQCYLYTAISRETGHHVLLKRFKKSKMSWDEVLKSRSLQFTQRSKIFPKMIEIFKNKGEYYIAYQKTTGPPLSTADTISPLSLQNFYPLLADLCYFLKQLRQFNPMVWVLPQWIYIHRNSVKIVHFEPFFPSKQMQSSDHVFIYKVQNNLITPNNNNNDNDSQVSQMPADKKRNLIFNLGVICYYLLTGSKQPQLKSEDEYLNYFADLQLNAEKRIIKITKQKKLGHMVGKMLCSNIFQLPDFDKISSFFQSKTAQQNDKKKGHTANIEIQLEKITLQTHRKEETEMKKRLRPCCLQKQASLQKINQQNKNFRDQKFTSRKHNHINLKDSTAFAETSLQKRGETFLPSIHKNDHKRMKTSSDLMNTTNSKPLMFGNRSAIFKYD